MLNYLGKEQDQLLNGVTMTTSISCHTHRQSDHDNQNSSESIYSLQFLSDNIPTQHRHQNQCPDLMTNMNQTKKTLTRPFYKEDSSQNRLKSSSNKNWQSVLHLDSKLFWTHQTNVLQKAQAVITKISQVILTEQYCKLKAYQRQLLSIVKQLEFSLVEYQKQKKCLVNQINMLKADNDSLYRTMLQLYDEMESLQNQCKQYVQNSLKQYIYSSSNIKSTKELNPKQIDIVPFARTFSHNMDEINLIKILEDQQKTLPALPISLFAQFVLDLKRCTGDIQLNYAKTYDLTPKLLSKFSQQSIIRQWIKQISQNLNSLQYFKQKTQQMYHRKPEFQQTQFKPKLIQEFIQLFAKNRNIILNKQPQHSYQQLYFFHVVHSVVITFLGILAKQTKQCYLQLSFGDKNQNWINILIKQLRNTKAQFNVCMKKEMEQYFNNLQMFISQINDLAVFRMLRLHSQW